jgi:hypothetical protein
MKILSFSGAPQFTHSVLCMDALMSRMQEHKSVKALHHKLHLWERTWLYQTSFLRNPAPTTLVHPCTSTQTQQGLAIHSFFGYTICTPRDTLYGVQPINLG